MISPLGQRQILQTAAVETVRQAMEGGLQVQREQARRQAFDAKLAEAMLDVSDVAETDVLKLTEQGAQERNGGRGHATGATEELPEEGGGDLPAEGAGPHVDLLA
ncbi:MAG: hypothetical protein HXX12_03960 [Geothrix sp.]|uniref:hypothetical protein n=1 Tax=Geothrix sp. TaxID=1962974 RepID=UPI0017BFEFE0|nr:hypothetical protein [Geothrix sp.]NWJ40108.1 hypothetical protein [Geothrix sp.]WIL21883.1 MAG: hypothetical protein QOZ81_001158 [Geothrix sp.]